MSNANAMLEKKVTAKKAIKKALTPKHFKVLVRANGQKDIHIISEPLRRFLEDDCDMRLNRELLYRPSDSDQTKADKDSMAVFRISHLVAQLHELDDIPSEYAPKEIRESYIQLKQILEEAETELAAQYRGALSSGEVSFQELQHALKSKGIKLAVKDNETTVVMEVLAANYYQGMFGAYLDITGKVYGWGGSSVRGGTYSFKVSEFDGRMKLEDLGICELTPELRNALIQRGKRYLEMVKKPSYMQHSGCMLERVWWFEVKTNATGRVMVDIAGFKQNNQNFYGWFGNIEPGREDRTETISDITDDILLCMSPFVYGFSFISKRWGKILVDNLTPINFRTDAWDKLVLDEELKEMVLALVDTDYTKAQSKDFIDGKGGGCIFLLSGPPGCGKAQPLDSIVYTPEGPRYMGSMKVDDTVLTPDGQTAKVLGVYHQGNRPVYEITFADGRKVKADENHLWKVRGKQLFDKRSGSSNEWDLVTTKRLYTSYRLADGLGEGLKHNKLVVPLTQPVAFNRAEVPVDPWLLGFLLGDGSFRFNRVTFSTADRELRQRVVETIPATVGVKFKSDYDYYISRGNIGGKENELLAAIRELGLAELKSEDKFIPAAYMTADANQRLALMQGLMDSDGHVGKSGGLSFSTTSKRLADQVRELVHSLGGIATITKRQPFYVYNGERKRGREAYNVRIRVAHPENFMTLERKKERCEGYQYNESLALQITGITYVGEEPTQCILVDHPDHLYLTDGYVVTHNTLTSEAVAERLQRPLYMVGIGELGTDVNQLEQNLSRVLQTAANWNAVLLLDEADIFLEARSDLNIQRNAMVGVFLRLLEYYPGILFLTSNRAKKMDQAFYSRISLALAYNKLPKAARVKVWTNILSLHGLEKQVDIDLLAETDVNGRQIKNIVNIATKLAAGQDRQPTTCDFEKVMQRVHAFDIAE